MKIHLLNEITRLNYGPEFLNRYFRWYGDIRIIFYYYYYSYYYYIIIIPWFDCFSCFKYPSNDSVSFYLKAIKNQSSLKLSIDQDYIRYLFETAVGLHGKTNSGILIILTILYYISV
jgi:hypothetical protein